jgi:hypothetical protein
MKNRTPLFLCCSMFPQTLTNIRHQLVVTDSFPENWIAGNERSRVDYSLIPLVFILHMIRNTVLVISFD